MPRSLCFQSLLLLMSAYSLIGAATPKDCEQALAKVGGPYRYSSYSERFRGTGVKLTVYYPFESEEKTRAFVDMLLDIFKRHPELNGGQYFASIFADITMIDVQNTKGVVFIDVRASSQAIEAHLLKQAKHHFFEKELHAKHLFKELVETFHQNYQVTISLPDSLSSKDERQVQKYFTHLSKRFKKMPRDTLVELQNLSQRRDFPLIRIYKDIRTPLSTVDGTLLMPFPFETSTRKFNATMEDFISLTPEMLQAYAQSELTQKHSILYSFNESLPLKRTWQTLDLFIRLLNEHSELNILRSPTLIAEFSFHSQFSFRTYTSQTLTIPVRSSEKEMLSFLQSLVKAQSQAEIIRENMPSLSASFLENTGLRLEFSPSLENYGWAGLDADVLVQGIEQFQHLLQQDPQLRTLIGERKIIADNLDHVTKDVLWIHFERFNREGRLTDAITEKLTSYLRARTSQRSALLPFQHRVVEDYFQNGE